MASTKTDVARRILINLMLIAAVFLSSVFGFYSVKAENSYNQPIERTKEEIMQYLHDNPSYINRNYRQDSEVYSELPQTSAPYKAGKLTDSCYTEFINAVNEIRYVAGLNPVTLNDDYNNKVQAACLVNHVNDSFTNYPKQPSDMDRSLYDLAVAGASNSILAYDYNGPAAAVYLLWGGDFHIETNLSNRRWLLNPAMKQTGYGEVYDISAMYVTDGFDSSAQFKGIAWPARLMPISLFAEDDCWSYSLGRTISDTEINSMKVTLKDDHSSKQWEFTKNNGNLNVGNENYGSRGAIIFRPDGFKDPSDGDKYSVTISGLQDGTIHYQVDFFDAKDYPDSGWPDDPTPAEPDEPTPAEPDDPTPVSPDELVIKANGVVNGPKGWAYYEDGEVVTSFTGFKKNDYGWWRIKDGYVDFDANSIYAGGGGKWFKTTGGKVTWKETGFFKNDYGWWYVKDSQVDFKANSIYKSQHGGWFKTTKNKVTWNETGIFKNSYGSWYVNKSKVDFNKNGKVTYNGKTYTVKNGKVV